MKRAAPAIAWSAFVVTLLLAIGWGAHAPHSWDVDNIAPGSVLRGMAARFGPGWYSSYGPVPYVMIGLLYAPILLAFRLTGELGVPTAEYPWGFAHPQLSVGTLIFAARLVCVALAAGVAVLATHERWSQSPRDAWLPPLLLAGSPAFVYYARTSNVDMFYLFFLALAFFFAERAARTRAMLAAGAAAALAICCKEQSAPFAAVAAGAAAWIGAPGSARPRRFALVALAAAAAYALAWGLPFNLQGWAAHHRFLFEQARYPRDYPATLAGSAALARHAVALLPATVGWPVLAGAAYGVIDRRRWKGMGARALALALYTFGFLAVIGYVYPRFLLPAMLLLLPLAIRGWSAALDRPGALRPILVPVLLAMTFLLGGPLLGIAQLRDSRYLAGDWLRARLAAAGDARTLARRPTAEVIGNPRFQVRLPAGLDAIAIDPDSLRHAPRPPRADAVLMSSFDAYVVRDDAALRAAWWEPLHDSTGAYRLALDLPPPRWTTAARGLPISPVVWIWVRRGGPLDGPATFSAGTAAAPDRRPRRRGSRHSAGRPRRRRRSAGRRRDRPASPAASCAARRPAGG